MPGRFSYTVIYEPVEDGGFYAHIPALDVTTEGETLAEAKEMARVSSVPVTGPDVALI